MISGKLRKKLGRRFCKGALIIFLLGLALSAIFGCAGAQVKTGHRRTKTFGNKNGCETTACFECRKEELCIKNGELDLDMRLDDQKPKKAISDKLATSVENNDTTTFDSWLERLQKLQSTTYIVPETSIIIAKNCQTIRGQSSNAEKTIVRQSQGWQETRKKEGVVKNGTDITLSFSNPATKEKIILKPGEYAVLQLLPQKYTIEVYDEAGKLYASKELDITRYDFEWVGGNKYEFGTRFDKK